MEYCSSCSSSRSSSPSTRKRDTASVLMPLATKNNTLNQHMYTNRFSKRIFSAQSAWGVGGGMERSVWLGTCPPFSRRGETAVSLHSLWQLRSEGAASRSSPSARPSSPPLGSRLNMSESRDNIFQSEDEGPSDSYMGSEQVPEDKVRESSSFLPSPQARFCARSLCLVSLAGASLFCS